MVEPVACSLIYTTSGALSNPKERGEKKSAKGGEREREGKGENTEEGVREGGREGREGERREEKLLQWTLEFTHPSILHVEDTHINAH